MMKWTRRYSMITGVALILLTNLVVLLGVRFNHSGLADSTLQLSQRELRIPYRWRQNNDNNGISLMLQWRLPGSLNEYQQYNNSPGWLDKAKLASLGFNVSMSIDTDRGRTTYQKQLSKPVFLVMEFDGPAYQQSIELAKKADADDSKKKAVDDKKKDQPTALLQELNLNSRLFIVDASLDREMLRAKYPDTRRYGIVRGQIQPRVVYDKEKRPLMTGYVKDVSAQSINVPFEFRDVFEPIQKKNQKYGYADNDKRSSFEATVAFGRRLEPWIVAASTK
ncbi:MAG: hypothetical protein JWQ61_1555 [Collimonas fungivorans]|uniref:DUF4824 family protein n=1 Tax=Collimonas fungivorans TaxID=158899 RepID=UPI0026EE2D3C|nr:DUF4824 family protein [Collimonas fungivorans]MDB5766741.1 hypothetical protein [Collimonas fungivorans]